MAKKKTRIIGARYFPFEKARPGQKQLMKDLSAALRAGKHLIAHAPPGIGKTAGALTPAAVWCRARGYRLLFLTSKHSQHYIAVETLKMLAKRAGDLTVVDIISREKMCPYSDRGAGKLPCQDETEAYSCPNLKCDNGEPLRFVLNNIVHVEEIMEMSDKWGVCPHRTALDAATEADVIVCDYNYVFSSVSDVIFPRINLDLKKVVLIVDEAHNLPDRIRENETLRLSEKLVSEASRECTRIDEQLSYYLKDLGQVLDGLDRELRDGMDEEGEAEMSKEALTGPLDELFATTLAGDQTYDIWRFMDDLENASRKTGLGTRRDSVARVGMFLRAWMDGGDYLRLYNRRGGAAVELYPTAPGNHCRSVFKEVRSALLMSGTLYPGTMYRDLLGLEDTRTVIRHYRSPFPPENRLLIATETVTTLFRERTEKMFQAVANQLHRLSLNTPGNLAVFFPSYEFLQRVRESLDRCYTKKAVLAERRGMNKTEKRGIFDELRTKQEGDGAIMLAVQGGSLSEGVDYSENLLAGICIVGLPLSPPTIRIKGLIRYGMKKFGRSKGYHYSYIYPAVNKVIQASGRPIRSRDARAFVVLMDRRFGQKRYRKAFPGDFNYEMVNDVAGRIEEFLKRPSSKSPQ